MCVMFSMLFIGHHFQIGQSVVRLVSVFVVDIFV